MVQEAVSMSHVLFTIAVCTGVTAAPYDYVLGAAYENDFHYKQWYLNQICCGMKQQLP